MTRAARILAAVLLAACWQARGQDLFLPWIAGAAPPSAVTYVQAFTTTFGSYVTTMDVTVAPTAGNDLVAVTAWTDAGAATRVADSVKLVTSGEKFTKMLTPVWGSYRGGGIFFLNNAPATSQVARFYYSGDVYVQACVLEVNGAGATQDRTGVAEQDGSVTVTSATNDLVVGLGIDELSAQVTADAGQTSRVNAYSGKPGWDVSTKAGATSVTMTWTGTTVFASGAIGIRP